MKRKEVPWDEVWQLRRQGASYRELAERYGVSVSTIGRQARADCWNRPGFAPMNIRMREVAARLQTQVEQRMQEELDTRELKELSAVLRELLRLQQELQGSQEELVRVVLEGETEEWSQ